MMNQTLKSASIERLKKLILDRYGKTLKIQWMRDVSALEIQDGTSIEFQREALSIPISFDNRYFATALVEDARKLPQDELLVITELVKMILEPEFYNFYLSQVFHNAKNANQEVASISNPIDMDAEPEAEEMGATLLCLQAMNPTMIYRIADEVHQLSQRWASLSFKDMQNNIFSVEDLLSLGNVTLLIEDILQLHPQHQELIYQYLMTTHKVSGPLMVIGAASTIESLEEQDMIHVGLAQLLKSQRLDLERLPRDPALLQETLEFMLHV